MSQNYVVGNVLQFVYHNTLRQVEVIEVKPTLIVTRDVYNQDVIKCYSYAKITCLSVIR